MIRTVSSSTPRPASGEDPALSHRPDPERAILLVRHAWAGQRGSYPGPDRDRPLDAYGEGQALRLPDHLRTELDDDLAGAQLVSSSFARCVQTLEPLAEVLGTTITLDERLAESSVPLRSEDRWPDAAWYGGRALAAVVEAADTASPLIVCSHGEVLPALVAMLAGREGITVPSTIDLSAKALEKGASWIVSIDPPAIAELAAPRGHTGVGRR